MDKKLIEGVRNNLLQFLKDEDVSMVHIDTFNHYDENLNCERVVRFRVVVNENIFKNMKFKVIRQEGNYKFRLEHDECGITYVTYVNSLEGFETGNIENISFI